MLITLDPHTGEHALLEVHDFRSFAVLVPSADDLPLDERAVPATLGRATPDGEHVVVRRQAVLALAGSSADDRTWQAGFEAMLAYALTRGWLTEDGSGIRAHCRAAAPPRSP